MRCHLEVDHRNFPTLLLPKTNTHKGRENPIPGCGKELWPPEQLYTYFFYSEHAKRVMERVQGGALEGGKEGADGFLVDISGIWVTQLLKNSRLLERKSVAILGMWLRGLALTLENDLYPP